MRLPFVFSAALLLSALPAVAASPIPILAAENFYGDLAQAIGGSECTVTSILTNPDQDPHLFEASPSMARALADARIVIYNGADYDPGWRSCSPPTGAGPQGHRRRRAVRQEGRRQSASLVRPGDHAGAGQGARRRNSARSIRPTRPDYDEPARDGRASLEPIDRQDRPRSAAEYAGAAGHRDRAGLRLHGGGLGPRHAQSSAFQLAVMNETEPSASEIAAFEKDLKSREVKVLFYNSQVTDPLTDRLLALAREAGVPVVGVSETEPPGKTYRAWMLGQLDATGQGAGGPSFVSGDRASSASRSRSAGGRSSPTSRLAIGEGEFVGVLGPNGAGKTTLMRAILGLIAPARRPRSACSASRRARGNPAVGYLPQIAHDAPAAFASAAAISSPARSTAIASACPSSAAPRTGARSMGRSPSSARASSPGGRFCRNVGRRAPAPALRPGADRPSARSCFSTSR